MNHPTKIPAGTTYEHGFPTLAKTIFSTSHTSTVEDIPEGYPLNDVDFMVSYNDENGTRVYHPAYTCWRDMYKRSAQTEGCYALATVCDEWALFSTFYAWWGANMEPGFVIDKDLRFPGNHHYSPNTCMMIPKSLNSTLHINPRKRGPGCLGIPAGIYPRQRASGVYYTVESYQYGVRSHLGSFGTLEEACEANFEARCDYLYQQSLTYKATHPHISECVNALAEAAWSKACQYGKRISLMQQTEEIK